MANQFTFNSVPRIRMSRTKHIMPQKCTTSASVGKLYPFYLQEVLPGDTFNVNTRFVSRLTSSYLRPVVDTLFDDIAFFFVPSRLCFDDWAGVFGENNESAWAKQTETLVPTTSATAIISSGTVADHFGLPIGSVPSGINVLPFRAFALIYDQWYRNENITDPMNVIKGDIGQSEFFNNNPWSPNNYTGQLPYVTKFKDYFTSALPSPQKSNSPVEIPLNVSSAGWYSLDTQANGTAFSSSAPLKLYDDSSYTDGGFDGMAYRNLALFSNTDSTNYRTVGTNYASPPEQGQPSGVGVLGSNAGINLPNFEGTTFTVNDLRLAFQTQRMLEADALYGTRYVEYLNQAFGVISPDARLQRSEYLGGTRVPLGVQQVASTVNNDDGTLGELGAYSQTNGVAHFNKGFVEHGFVIGVHCIRYHHSYSQGIERMWFRHKRLDYYAPVFAHLGLQPIYATELFADGALELRNSVFGYTEAWSDYRHRKNIISGDIRSDIDNSLDIYTFADDYATRPYLTDEFILEDPQFVDRTLAVPSTSQDQFIFQFYTENEAIRVMPPNSVPGLIDHY